MAFFATCSFSKPYSRRANGRTHNDKEGDDGTMRESNQRNRYAQHSGCASPDSSDQVDADIHVGLLLGLVSSFFLLVTHGHSLAVVNLASRPTDSESKEKGHYPDVSTFRRANRAEGKVGLYDIFPPLHELNEAAFGHQQKTVALCQGEAAISCHR
jgi:hypothetical protein